jgi:hypothetical protein
MAAVATAEERRQPISQGFSLTGKIGLRISSDIGDLFRDDLPIQFLASSIRLISAPP